MRIVAGRHRGRRLRAPKGERIRPTADRAREALFNILAHRCWPGRSGPGIAALRVLDAFCGTGALGLEALSRGAASVVFLDSDREALALARANAGDLGEEPRSRFVLADATKPPAADSPCDLAFLDPPYGSGLGPAALAALARKGWLAEGALAVVEIGAKEEFTVPPGFRIVDERRYGAARFVMLEYRPR